MARHIDAHRLREELQKPKIALKAGNYYLDNSEQAVGYENALVDFELLIDSLQQEQSKIEEDWVKKRKQECGCRRLSSDGRYQCERYEGVFGPCDGRCSWVVDYPKLKKLEKQPEVDINGEIHKESMKLHTAPTYEELARFARHFYELGKNSKDILPEEPDKSLDEAAETHVKNKYCLTKLLGAEIQEAVNDFIAGANWMAGQGVSWEDEMTYYDGFLLYGKDERAFTMEGNFNEGDEVIVQIRKKEESK